MIANIASSAHEVCCLSNWLFQGFKNYLPTLKDKLRIIYYGLSLPKVEPLPLSFSPPTLLLLGRLVPEKGFDTAIRAFSFLKKKGIQARLLIAGEGPERQSLEDLVHELGLSSFVQFVGELARDKVPSLINQATVMIVPSYSESFGLVAIEAMHLQRPVIASTVGGLQEIVCHQETGLLVPPQNPSVLAIAIEDLLTQPKKAIEMGIQGYRRAVENFTLEKNLNQHENLFHETISQCHYSRL